MRASERFQKTARAKAIAAASNDGILGEAAKLSTPKQSGNDGDSVEEREDTSTRETSWTVTNAWVVSLWHPLVWI